MQRMQSWHISDKSLCESGVWMEAWIIYFRDRATYNQQYIEFYIGEGRKLGISVRLILVEELEFGVRDGDWFISLHGMEPHRPDFVVMRAIYPLLSKQLGYMGFRVFNNAFIAEICNDKAKTYQYLAKTGIRMVTTEFCLNKRLPDAMEGITGPTVIKAVDGHGGSQVFLVGDASERGNTDDPSAVLSGIGSSDAVVQPLTGNRHQDLRVYVIGREIVAAVLRTAKDGFKSNFSLGGEVRLYDLSKQERALVHLIMDQFDFGLVGIDFIIGDDGELIFNEIEDVAGARMLYQCSDINIVERYLNYIVSKL